MRNFLRTSQMSDAEFERYISANPVSGGDDFDNFFGEGSVDLSTSPVASSLDPSPGFLLANPDMTTPFSSSSSTSASSSLPPAAATPGAQSNAVNWSGLTQSIGMWGATITSLATGNSPAQPTMVYSGTQPMPASSNNLLLFLLLGAVVVFLIYKYE